MISCCTRRTWSTWRWCIATWANWTEAETVARESIELVRQVRGEDHPDMAAGQGLLASLAQARDDLDRAEQLYQQALEGTRRALGQSHPAAAAVLGDLAGLCAAAGGRSDEAVALYRQACDIVRRTQGEDHVDHVNLLRQLAGLYQALGQPDHAEPSSSSA